MAEKSIAEYRAMVRHFNKVRHWAPFNTIKNMASALSVESAEIAEEIVCDGEARSGKPSGGLKKRIAHELSDLVFILCEIANRCGFDLVVSLRSCIKQGRMGVKK